MWCSTSTPWPDLVARARTVEALGYHGFWVADHFMPNGDDVSEPMLECFGVLSAVAAITDRVRIGSLVAGNTYRHPAVLANQVTTIDHVSGGRMVCGLGAGWQQNEHDAYGIELDAPPARIARFEEACRVVLGLRDQPRTDLDGRYYRLVDAPMEPKPIGPLPLFVGSSGPRMARIVARHADEWNTWGTPEGFAEKSALVDAGCEAEGRDPATLRRSTQALMFLGPDGAEQAERLAAIRPAIGGTAEQLRDVVGRYAEAGVDELIVPDFTLGDQVATADALAFLAEEVVGAP